LSRLAILLVSLLICLSYKAGAEEPMPFKTQVNKSGVNIRTDSTVNSEKICDIAKDTNLEVVKESYGWYKVRLPKNAPSFIRKDLINQIAGMPDVVIKDRVNIRLIPDESSSILGGTRREKLSILGEVIKERVNIRLGPNESAPILGKADKNEIINILGEEGGWYKIEPTNNCFGWINKGFLVKLPAKNQIEPTQAKTPPIDKEKLQPDKEDIASLKEVTIEGIVKPQGVFFRRIATHKLITTDNKIYLLKGNKPELDTLNYRKVTISGILTNLPNQKYPLIEIKKFGVID